MELIVCVNSELRSRAISIWVYLMNRFTATTSVTIVVVSIVIWSITSMWCHSEGIFVSLHKVHLWAPLISNVIGITVIIVSWTCVERPIFVLAWRRHHVESSVASTVYVSNIDVIFNRATKEIWLVEFTCIHPLGFHQFDSTVVEECVPISSGSVTASIHEHLS
jgi:hypothetical protein